MVDAVILILGPDQVWVRLSPSEIFNDMTDFCPKKIFGYMTEQLNGYPVTYLHLVEPNETDLGHGNIAVENNLFRRALLANLDPPARIKTDAGYINYPTLAFAETA